jgi:hypothetical protein
MFSKKVLLLAHDAHFGIHEMFRSIPKIRTKELKRSMCMSFFVMPYTFTGVGRFKMVQSTISLSSIAPYTRLPDGGQVCTFLKRP